MQCSAKMCVCRLNLGLLEVIAERRGIVIVDRCVPDRQQLNGCQSIVCTDVESSLLLFVCPPGACI